MGAIANIAECFDREFVGNSLRRLHNSDPDVPAVLEIIWRQD